MVLTIRDLIEQYKPYNVPPVYEALPFTPENFVKIIRKFVLECGALPQIRTKVAGNRRLVYNGLLAIYLIPWGGDPKCQTVVLYGVPEELWLYMDQSKGEWKVLYRQFVEQLYGELSEEDYRVLGYIH